MARRERTYLIAFVLLGILASFAGPALSHLRERVGTTDSGISWVFVGTSLGYFVGATLGGRFADRGRAHQMWAGSLVVVLAAFAAITAERNLALMVATFGVFGAAAAIGDTSGNTLVVWSRPGGQGALLNALHLCFALGALVTPLLTNRALAWAGNLWPMLVPLGVLSAYSIYQLLTTEPPVKTREVVHHHHDGPIPPARRRQLQLLLVTAFFVVYVALEVGFFGWIHTYVERIGYGNANTATGVTAVFWAGFVLGRLLAVWLSSKVSIGQILFTAVALTLVVAVAFMFANGPGIGLWVVAFLFGLAQAPQFASMVGYAETHFVLSGRATSAFLAAAGLGGLVMPRLIGSLFDSQGPKSLPVVMLVAAVITAVLALSIRAMVGWRSAQRPPLTSMNAPVT